MPPTINLNDPTLRAALQERTTTASALLEAIARDHAPAVLASSLGAEDMVLTDLIARAGLDIAIVTLDTGRLPAETYELMQQTEERYGLRLQLYFPRHDLLEPFVRNASINAFYHSVELRKQCCHIRKVEPLQRALAGKRAWITGMRAQQAETRKDLPLQAFDEDHGLFKFNPLAAWSEKEVWAYIRLNDVPYNRLHDQFYASIGCAPCTRAIAVGEDVRAGRWWWESPENRECGLHPSRTNPKESTA